MKISAKKKEKISEQILSYLYSVNPNSIFTSQIAEEIARDEEFVKNLLLNLKKRNLIIEIKKKSQRNNLPKKVKMEIKRRSI